MDNGIEMIVNNYFKANPETINPFIEKVKDEKEFLKGKVPKDAVVLTEEGIKSKGNSKKAADRGEQKEDVVIEEPIVEPIVEKTEEEQMAEIKEAIELLEMLGDDADEEAKEALEILKTLI